MYNVSADFPGRDVTPTTPAQTEGVSGLTSCLLDNDCPTFSSCTQLDGLHVCVCDLGRYFHPDLGCVTARTFPARISGSVLHSAHGTIPEDNGTRSHQGAQISRQVTELFHDVLGHVRGYLSTSVTSLLEGQVTIVHHFSMLDVMTEEALQEELTVSILRCEEKNGSCISTSGTDVYQSLSLCDFPFCDPASSSCQSEAGLVTCECLHGYYQFSSNDRSCRACDSGFWRTEGQCQRCPLGYGGFNCQEAFMLAVIVESCALGVLVVSLVTALYYHVRRKEKPKPTLRDSLVFGVSTDQPVLRLPRAQFSWRREWEWTDPPGKTPEDVHRDTAMPDLSPVSEPSDIQMRTFGSAARPSVTNPYRGSHNLAFIGDN